MPIQLQSPKGKRWPDFFGTRSSERGKIESAPAVQDLIKCGYLLSKELNSLLYDFLSKSQSINDLLTIPITFNEEDWNPYNKEIQKLAFEKIPSNKEIDATEQKSIIAGIISEYTAKIVFEKRSKRKVEIKKISDTLEDALSDFCASHGNIELKILDHSSLYYCPKCSQVFKTRIFQGGICGCGNQIGSVSQTLHDSIVRMDAAAEIFVKKNMWLEHGVERVFSEVRHRTLCGVYVLGFSGVSHEVDVIGERSSGDGRFIVECKTREIYLSDVFKLYGQMSDIGCSAGYIFSTSEIADPRRKEDVKRLASSKNIKIMHAVLEHTAEDIKKFVTS